jgi:hypothetical protein
VVIDAVPWLSSAQQYVLISNLEPGSVVFSALVYSHETRCSRQVIDDPFCHITLLDHLLRTLQIRPANRPGAQDVALFILAHDELNVRLCYAIATQNFADIQGYRLSAEKRRARVAVPCGRANKRQVVVRILQLGIIRIHFVDEERYRFILFVTLDRPASGVLAQMFGICQGLCRRTWYVECLRARQS